MPAIRPVAAAAILLIFPVLAWTRDQGSPAAPATATPTQSPAAPATVPTVDSTTLANNVIFETIIKLRLRPRVAARIEQVVDMLNQKFALKGFYYKDTDHRIRLQLELEGAGKNESTMLQVCDGKVLWDFQRVLGMKDYRKREITPILEKLKDPALDDNFRTLVLSNLGFGGPESLLTGFQATIGFDQFADEVVDGVPSFVLGGKWKNRDGLFGPNDRPPPPTAPLPPYIPSNIRIFIDKANLWPYRIEMIGNAPSLMEEDTREIDKNSGRPVGVRRPPPKVTPSSIVLRYILLPDSEIKPDEQFVFTPPRDETNVTNDTENFLKLLDQGIQAKINERKAKEAAGEPTGDAMIKASPLDLPTEQPAPIGTTPPGPAPPK